MSAETKLLRCPFCNADGDSQCRLDASHWGCSSCGARGPTAYRNGSDANLIAAWNTRHADGDDISRRLAAKFMDMALVSERDGHELRKVLRRIRRFCFDGVREGDEADVLKGMIADALRDSAKRLGRTVSAR